MCKRTSVPGPCYQRIRTTKPQVEPLRVAYRVSTCVALLPNPHACIVLCLAVITGLECRGAP